MNAEADDKKITRAIIAMAHGMRLKVVAEGVETVEQLAFLRSQRCDSVQGYLLYKPLPEQDIVAVLAENRRDAAIRVAVDA